MKWAFAVCALALALMCQAVYAIDVGVSPSVVDLGEVNRGETKFVTFYLLTSYDRDLSVLLEAVPGTPEFFRNPRYPQLLQNYSEEDTTSWVKPISNPVLLKYNPSNPMGQIKSWRNVDFLLKVPADAEPGVHLVVINPKPVMQEGMVGINAIVPVTILFTVPGNAVRSGEILDIIGYMSGSTMSINTMFLNNGSVTIRPMGSVDIYNGSNIVKTITQATGLVKPGEMYQLIGDSGIGSGGKYNVFSNASYITGFAVKSAPLRLGIPPAAHIAKGEEKGAFPLWVILIIIAIIIVYIILR
jgi:hypothetical protein